MSGFADWMRRGGRIITEHDFKTKVLVILTIIMAFWMIPISYASDTENDKLIYILILLYGLFLWMVIGIGVWFLI